METRRAQEDGEEFKAIRRGWCLGAAEFRRELLAQIAEKRGDWQYGPELAESAQEQAERLIAEGLQREGWTNADLAGCRKGDSFRVRLAAKVRAETTVTLGWITEWLRMGARGHLTHLLYRHGQSAPRDSAQGQFWK